MKRLVEKSQGEFVNYRASELPGSVRSLGEMSMNRKLRTKLSIAEEHATMHKLPDIKQKSRCAHGSNQLKPLETIEKVRVRGVGVWGEKGSTQLVPGRD